jgi:hypothetical protein
MIPRPEHEANVFEGEAMQLEKRLAALRDRVIEIQSGGGIGGPLKVPNRSTRQPPRHRVSFGYEVIPHAEAEDAENNPDHIVGSSCVNESCHRLSVIFSTDEDDFVDIATSNEVILEHDGESVYEVDEIVDSGMEEEGMEVVGLGRYSTVVDEEGELHHDLMATESMESVIEDKFSRLSQQYPSSRNVDIAFYRPLQRAEGPVGEHLKEE